LIVVWLVIALVVAVKAAYICHVNMIYLAYFVSSLHKLEKVVVADNESGLCQACTV